MTICEPERDTLIGHRISQAHEAIEEAEFLIENLKLKLAVNRIYYGMFYVLTALALKYKFQTSKHHQLLGWFNKTFLKDKLIDPKYGKMAQKAFKGRSDGDYGVCATFEKADVQKMFADMKDFIATIEAYIKENEA